MRAALLALVLASQVACSTLSTLHGAEPLAKGKHDFTVGLSLQTGSNALSYAGVPIPQLEFAGRWGLGQDVDFGFRTWLLGAGFDTRYRFYHQDRYHLAVAPAVGGFYLPGIGGSFEFHAPLLGQVDLARWAKLSGGPRVVMRDQINPVSMPSGEKGRIARIDVFAGAGARMELALGKRAWIGFSTDLYAQPARHAIPGWSLALDFAFRKVDKEAKTPR